MNGGEKSCLLLKGRAEQKKIDKEKKKKRRTVASSLVKSDKPVQRFFAEKGKKKVAEWGDAVNRG